MLTLAFKFGHVSSIHFSFSMLFPGHAAKNTGGQLMSHLRTVHYGPFWCDMVGARTRGLPPQALGRESPMSDRLQALLMNPWFYVDGDIEPR